VPELVQLTLDFYRRNYIEGLFLSSGIIRNPDYTMEQVIAVARTLRAQHDFRGYIHLKTIPDASPELIAEAGRYADRLSINIELPTPTALARLAPEKDAGAICRSMARVRLKLDEQDDAKGARRKPKPFAPAGQSTQMIVGADASDDRTIVAASANLYSAYNLKRVYYSAFSPIPDSSAALPLKAPPLVREHRLYQADWLMRFYGFDASEIVRREDGMLDLDIDPKLAWALANHDKFPVDVNRADREMLLRVPGFGVRTVARLIRARRVRAIRSDELVRLGVSMKKCSAFIVLPDLRPSELRADASTGARSCEQLSLFENDA
jgi:putative DNA modification/repair radical SAM protein